MSNSINGNSLKLFTPEGMVLIETAEGITLDEVRSKTEANFSVASEYIAK